MRLHEVFAKNVKARRVSLGLTQEQLAHEVGIDLSYLGQIERAARNPTLLMVERIASKLGVDPGDLLRAVP